MRIIGIYICFVIIVSNCFFMSCKKKEIFTETERLENELRSVIKEKKILRVVPIKGDDSFTNSISALAGDKFEFSDGFLRVNGFPYDAYNLQALKSYKVALVTIVYNSSQSRSEEALLVYFN